MERVKLRELLNQFVQTESISPSLLKGLDAKMAEALVHDIDTEIVRNSLIDLLQSTTTLSKPKNSLLINSNSKNGLDPLSEFWLGGECKGGDSSSLSSDISSHTSTSSSPFARRSSSPPLMVQRKMHGIADELARSSTNFRAFRLDTLELCREVVHELWRLGKRQSAAAKAEKKASKICIENGKKQQKDIVNNNKKASKMNGFFDHSPSSHPLVSKDSSSSPSSAEDGDYGTEQHRWTFDESGESRDQRDNGEVLALSSFSLGHSMQELPEAEMQNIVWLICSDGIEQTVRLTNIRKLHLVSPLAFSKSKAFEIFLGHLHAILQIPLLFNDIMHLLARIMNCPNETIWVRCVTCISRVSLGIMRSQTLVREDKRAFTNFIRQTLELGPHIWRHFIDPQNVAHIVQNFMEMLTAEISAGGGGGPTPDGFLAV